MASRKVALAAALALVALVGCTRQEAAALPAVPPVVQKTAFTEDGSVTAVASVPSESNRVTPFADVSRPTPSQGGCRDHGYGGKYLMRDTSTFVYLIVDMPEGPAAAATAAAETMCAMGSPVPTTYFEVRKAEYRLSELEDWQHRLDSLRDKIGRRRFLASWIDVMANKVHLEVETERAKQEIEALMDGLGVPADAVALDLRRRFQLDDPPVLATPPDGLELAIRVDRGKESTSTATTLAVVLINRGAATSTVTYNAAHPVDVAVFTDDGREIWKLLKGVLILPGATVVLAPGESVDFEVAWDHTDNDGIRVTAGRFLVRGFMRVSIDSPGRHSLALLATPPLGFETEIILFS